MRPVRLARQARLRQLIDEAGGPKALAAIVKSPDTHLIALAGGSKQMGDKLARKIETATGRPLGWLDTPPKGERPSDVDPPHLGMAHNVSPHPFETPQHVQWGELMTMKELPGRFSCEVPDDALAPQTPKGTILIFERQTAPQPGHGVLIEDATGQRYIRRYIPGTSGRWSAAARNDAYPVMDSERDGLNLLAVATGRLDGAV